MTTDQIKTIRETFKGVPGVVIDIHLDNDIILHQGLKEEITLWDDANERLTNIKINNRINQRMFPFEIQVTGYEHIQNMYAATDIEGVEKFLKSVKYDKTNDLIKYLSNLTITSASITGSTGDLIDWNKRNTLEEQDEYSKVHAEQIAKEMGI